MGVRRRIEYILKHNPWILTAFETIGGAFFRGVGHFIKTDDNLVLLCSYSGKNYNDSPRAIYEKMLKDPRCKDFHYVWAMLEPGKIDIPGKCEQVKIDTWQYFKAALKAKVWISNVNIERGLRFKKKDQYYLNTWHGASMTWVGNAMPGRNDFHWGYVDGFCYSGEYEREIVKQCFDIVDEHLLPTGIPRNDDLYTVDDERVKRIKKELNIPADKKVILYAPTWRESSDNGATCDIAPPIHIEKWRERLADEYVLIFRAHHNTKEMLGIEYDDFVRNGSDYPIVNDLMVISDFLVSDYSGIVNDFSILCRPIAEFGYDYEEYVKTRGFFWSLDEEVPSGLLHTEDEVLDYITKCDYASECEKVRAFRDKFMEYGGRASEQCIDAILKGIGKTK